MNVIGHTISEPWIKKIGAILKEHAGARDSDLDGLSALRENARDSEIRFCGGLGFGGKFRHNYRRWGIDCYSESMNPERAEMIKQTNQALASLRLEFLQAHPVFRLSMTQEVYEKALRAIHGAVREMLRPYEGKYYSPWLFRRLEEALGRYFTRNRVLAEVCAEEALGGAIFYHKADGTVEIYSRTMYLWIRLLFIHCGATFSWVGEFDEFPR